MRSLDRITQQSGVMGGGRRYAMPGARIREMKLKYYPDTDSLYIDLSGKSSAESREISEGIVLDYDDSGSIVGIDIDNASKKVELDELMIDRIPFTLQTITA